MSFDNREAQRELDRMNKEKRGRGSNEEAQELIEQITEWQETNENANEFDDSFVVAMQQNIDNGRVLSTKQVQALKNIVEGWVERKNW